MKKKIGSIFLSIFLMLGMGTSTVFASDGNSEVVKNYDEKDNIMVSGYDSELTDEVLLNSKFDGMSTKDGMYQFKFTTDYMSKEMGATAKAKGKEFLSRTGVTMDSMEPMARTTTVLTVEDEQQAQELISRIAGDSRDENKFDVTRGVRATLTVYYVEGRFPTGQDSLLVTGVEGSVRIDDKNISVLINDENFVEIGCNDGFVDTIGQHYTYDVKRIPFSESTPSNWTPIDVSQQFVGGAGATWQIPLRRAETYWDMVVENVLYGEITIY